LGSLKGFPAAECVDGARHLVGSAG
jgi:hypothetical protein